MDEVINKGERVHIEHGEHRYHARGSSIKDEWWEVYEDGKWLCQCCDPDDAERIKAALDRIKDQSHDD